MISLNISIIVVVVNNPLTLFPTFMCATLRKKLFHPIWGMLGTK